MESLTFSVYQEFADEETIVNDTRPKNFTSLQNLQHVESLTHESAPDLEITIQTNSLDEAREELREYFSNLGRNIFMKEI